MIEFISEGVKIQGDQFRLDARQWLDEHGETHTSYTSWGHKEGTCAWFWISPKERARLVSLGVEFVRG
jgi:hypothetical protein